MDAKVYWNRLRYTYKNVDNEIALQGYKQFY